MEAKTEQPGVFCGRGVSVRHSWECVCTSWEEGVPCEESVRYVKENSSRLAPDKRNEGDAEEGLVLLAASSSAWRARGQESRIFPRPPTPFFQRWGEDRYLKDMEKKTGRFSMFSTNVRVTFPPQPQVPHPAVISWSSECSSCRGWCLAQPGFLSSVTSRSTIIFWGTW